MLTFLVLLASFSISHFSIYLLHSSLVHYFVHHFLHHHTISRMLSLIRKSVQASSQLGALRALSGDVGARFDAAQVKLNTLTEDPGNMAKLKIYGLFKQVSSSLG